MSDVVVIGAGMVGAACAYYAARAGLDVTVVDRGPVAGGTSGAGEGNLLISDKPPGPELDLMLVSLVRWAELDADVGGFEFEHKGGLMVAATEAGAAELNAWSRHIGPWASRPNGSTTRANASPNWRPVWPAAPSIRRTPRCNRPWPPPDCCTPPA